MEYLPALFLFLAGACNGFMDMIQFHFEDCILNGLGDFWHPIKGADRKWKNGDKKQGEAFWLSSTLLVRFTDGFHTMKHFMILFIRISVLLPIIGCLLISLEMAEPVTIKEIVIIIPITYLAWWVGFWSIYENKLIRYNK